MKIGRKELTQSSLRRRGRREEGLVGKSCGVGLPVAAVPPLRGRRAAAAAKEKAGHSGRDDGLRRTQAVQPVSLGFPLLVAQTFLPVLLDFPIISPQSPPTTESTPS